MNMGAMESSSLGQNGLAPMSDKSRHPVPAGFGIARTIYLR
jgi:hypothetical protein